MPSAAAVPPARGTTTVAARPLPSVPPVVSPSESPSTPPPTTLPVTTGSAEAIRRLQQSAIRQVLADGGPLIVYQPQLSLSRLVVDGYEALARFPESPLRGTEAWFARARELGLGPAIEASALQRALNRQHERPAGSTLAVNLSPGALTSPAVAAVLPDDLTGIEIELTEHEWAPSGGRLRRQLDLLRERGARVAIDDVGVAHSGLRRVMDLAPDRIKLDKHLVQGVAGNTAKNALIRAVVDFADHIDAAVVAEGVENVDDLEALAELDVGYAQGWMIGLPEPDFQDADPVAIASGRDSLARMLAGRRARPTPTRAGVPHISPGGRPAAAPGFSPTEQLVSPDRYDATADVEELLAQLTRVTSLAGLGALAGTCAGVLGGDSLLISVLTEDGTAIRSVRSQFSPHRAQLPDPPPEAETQLDGRISRPLTDPLEADGSNHPLGRDDPDSPSDPPGQGEVFTLADFPITRRCLETRAVIPIYLGRDGDASEWRVLARLGFEAALLVPVISRDRVIGLLECYRSSTTPWSRRQIRSARTVAAMLGPVLDLTLTR